MRKGIVSLDHNMLGKGGPYLLPLQHFDNMNNLMCGNPSRLAVSYACLTRDTEKWCTT